MDRIKKDFFRYCIPSHGPDPGCPLCWHRVQLLRIRVAAGSPDAEEIAECLRQRQLPEERLDLLVGNVKKEELESRIHQFIQMVKSTSQTACDLVVVFFAAHGKQPHTSELPAILPSDIKAWD